MSPLRMLLAVALAAAAAAPAVALSWPLCEDGGQVWVSALVYGEMADGKERAERTFAVLCSERPRACRQRAPPLPERQVAHPPPPYPHSPIRQVTEGPRTQPGFPGSSLWFFCEGGNIEMLETGHALGACGAGRRAGSVCVWWGWVGGVVWCGVVWCGVVWCGVVWCGVVWCGVVWCGVVWCGVVWCGVVWCGVVWCGVVWCGVVWCGVVWCGVVWCGVVWCGVVWCGVVWCGVVWCGVVWCGVVWCVWRSW